MKSVIVVQWVRAWFARVPPDQSQAGRSVAKPACVSVRGGTKPGGASLQAVLLNPEICIVVASRITPKHRSQSRRIEPTEGSSPRSAMASERDTTGVVRAGHEHKRITRELERARCFHAKRAGRKPAEQVHGVGNALSPADERNQRACMVSQYQRQAECCETGVRQS
jgi:hypothetical protein